MVKRRTGMVYVLGIGLLSWLSLAHAAPPPYTNKVTMIKGSTAPVYMVVNGTKRHFTATSFAGCHMSFGDVVTVTDDIVARLPDAADITTVADCEASKALPAFPNGALIKGSDAPVYMVVNGVKRHLTGTAFADCGLSFDKVGKWPDGITASLPTGADLTTGAECKTLKAH